MTGYVFWISKCMNKFIQHTNSDYQSKFCLILNVITCYNSYWIRKGRIVNDVKIAAFWYFSFFARSQRIVKQTPCLGKLETILCGVCYRIRWEKTVAKKGFVNCTVGKSCCQKTFRSQTQISVRRGIHRQTWEREAWGAVSSLMVRFILSSQFIGRSNKCAANCWSLWQMEDRDFSDWQAVIQSIVHVHKPPKTPIKPSPLFSSLSFSLALCLIFGKSIRFWWIKAVSSDKTQSFPL